MLQALYIKDFIIVETCEITLNSGLTVFTGETGAGKSIIMNAIALCLGDKARADFVRTGASKADISATFEVNESLSTWLNEHGFDDDTLILRRVIDTQGKSKAFINGIPSTITQLKTIAQQLIDIHGQHAHQQLLKSQHQMHLLDAQGDLSNVYLEVKHAWHEWSNAKQQLEQATLEQSETKQKLERLQWQLNEMSSLQLHEGEWEEIQEEHPILSHAAELIADLNQIQHQLTEDHNSIETQLYQCIRLLQNAVKIDPKLTSLLETLESAHIQCKDAGYDIAHYLNYTDLNEARLEEIDTRLQAIHSCSQRFGIEPENILAHIKQLQTDIDTLETHQNLEHLQQQVKKSRHQYFEKAQILSQQRTKTAHILSQQMTEGMQTLAMKGGQFKVNLNACEPSAHGLENIQFLVSGHIGSEPQPLNKIASGGELARISLLLSVIANQSKQVPTLIFDEVDSGIGGAVADKIGQLLRTLGQQYQILCITHLPQVASKGHQHVQVTKYEKEGQTYSSLTPLDQDNRTVEIARMLAGSDITQASLENAKSLLEN